MSNLIEWARKHRGVLLFCLIVQLLFFWLWMVYAPPSGGLVAYQKF